MILNNRDIAILYFSRSAQAEVRARKWELELGYKFAFKALRHLIQHSKKIAQSTDYPVFHINERNQIGANFEERFTNAIESIFQKGYQKVIAIGNDCAELSSNDIEMAALSLEKNKVVIGQTQKGGLYIFGIQAEAFQKETLKSIAWQSHQVATSILAIQEFEIGVLETKSEFHSFRELVQLLKKQRITASLKEIARLLIQLFYINVPEQHEHALIPVSNSVIRRGPPIRNDNCCHI